MPDDLIELLPRPKDPQDSSRPDPKYDSIESLSLPPRDSSAAFFIDFAAYYIPTAIAVFALRHHRGGWPIAAAIGYTLTIPFILSNRYLGHVPWDLFSKHWKKFLPMHCAALVIVSVITAWAFDAKPNLPAWFITSGRRPALFYYCLGGILLAMAFWECSWISKYKKRSEES